MTDKKVTRCINCNVLLPKTEWNERPIHANTCSKKKKEEPDYYASSEERKKYITYSND